MAYQEVKTTGYGARVGGSFKAIGFGFLLFIAGTVLLWWNEGRALKTDKMLGDAEEACVTMDNPNKIDRSLDGELVCATAVANTADSLCDTKYGIGAVAIALKRNVEYYQWVEHSESKSEDKFGGKEETTTTYTYSKEWVDKPVESSRFKDPAYQQKNKVLTEVESQELWAENVSFGAYRLSESLIHRISSVEPMGLAFDEDRIGQMNAEFAGGAADSVEYVHQMGNVLYYGCAPNSPQVGDVRVTFEKVVPAKVTIISQVVDDTFKPFKAKNGKRFETLRMGKRDADEIFEAEHNSNSIWLWIFRIAGILVVIAGLRGVFGFLETLLKVVPFVANIVGWGVGTICSVVGVVWSLIVIATAWLFYRPLLGILLLAVAGLLVWLFAFKGKDKLKVMMANKTNSAAK